MICILSENTNLAYIKASFLYYIAVAIKVRTFLNG
jgi:hypothetical protein